ncbi:MAG: DUF2332 domain-containing protein, partial [Acidisphaera sp.]|nr:DUF2332 domain-containing protein [Acidisphaera sp.]
LHVLVLTGTEQAFEACYPPKRGDDLAARIDHVLATRSDWLRDFTASPPQTNEVGRSAVLLGGFARIAATTDLPLRTLEIGASAGLNSAWDHYRYDVGGACWGNASSTVGLAPDWRGASPRLGPIRIAERLACDARPIDLEDDAQRLRLRAYVWPDQPARLARIDAAIGLVRALRLRVEPADATSWLRVRLAQRATGAATVVFHSIMWQYMPDAAQRDATAIIADAGGRADAAAPVAWLRFEPTQPEARPELRLTLWPDGRETHLASAHPHGTVVDWRGDAGVAG